MTPERTFEASNENACRPAWAPVVCFQLDVLEQVR